MPGSNLKQLGEVISLCVCAVIELRLEELCALKAFHRRIKKTARGRALRTPVLDDFCCDPLLPPNK